MKHNVILLFAVAFCVILFSRCKDDDPEPIVLSQETLNATDNLFKSETGSDGAFDIAHNGQPTGGDSTIRDIFTSTGSAPVIEPGTVVTKHTYAKNEDGSKGQLFVTFAMIKHLEGYSEVSNDWEYISMPNNDETVDYSVNPNGVLANAAVSGVPAADLNCVTCHAAAGGGDQLFSND